jgi:hypothetical protein
MNEHCESCGNEIDWDDNDGICCGSEFEACDGTVEFNFKIGTINRDNTDRKVTGTVRACCGAKAQAKLPEGIRVLSRA